MHQTQKPTSFRRVVSALLSVALVASVTPAIAIGGPRVAPTGGVATLALTTSALEANGVVLTPGSEPWFAGDVDSTITATPEADVATIAAGINTESLTETTTNPLRLPKITAEGTTTIRFYSIDYEGGQEATKTVYIKVDKSGPNTTATVTPSSWTSQTVNVTLNAPDPYSGLDKLWYRVGAAGSVVETTQVSVALAISAEGTTPVSFWARDKAGNETATKTVDARIDKIAPTTTSNRVASYVNTATINFTATDAGGSGVKKTYYQLDSKPVMVGSSVTTTETTPTPHSLKFWSEDNAGNVEGSHTVTFTVAADTGAPVTTLVTKPGLDLNDWQSSVVTFSLTATDTPPGASAGVAHTYYRLDGGTTVTYTPGAVVTVSKEGSTLLEYWSVDTGGVKETTNTATIKVDRIKPTSSHDALAEYLGSSSITIAAADGLSGIGTMQYSLNGGSWVPLTGFTPGAASVVVSVPPVAVAGNHTIQYVVTDRAGNREDTRTVGPFHITRSTLVVFTSKSAWLSNTSNPAKVTVAGKLLDGGTPLAGKQLLIDYSSRSDFKYKISIPVTTTAEGTFALRRNVWNRSYYRIRFVGDADYAASSSSLLVYVPRAGLSTPKAPTIVRAGRRFWVSGSIKPGHKGRRVVFIQRYQVARGTRIYRGGVWASIYPRGATWSNYQARLVLSRGTWYVRAYAPYDFSHRRTYSSLRRIVVR